MITSASINSTVHILIQKPPHLEIMSGVQRLSSQCSNAFIAFLQNINKLYAYMSDT